MSSGLPTYYNADAVREVLTWPLVNKAVESALVAIVKEDHKMPSSSFAFQPKRTFTACGKEPGKILLTMPAYVGNYKLKSPRDPGEVEYTVACKLVTSFSGNPRRDLPLPSIQAHVLLFDYQTGQLSAIMEGTDLTTWRTVSASLVATKYLYFRRFGAQAEQERNINVAIVGCGVQGQLHAAAFCAHFRVRQLNLYNRTQAKAQDLAYQLRQKFSTESGTQINVCSSPNEACHDADIICIATYSKEPLINLASLKANQGVHINAVGAGENHFSEVAPDIYQRAKVYVDCYANAEAELVGLPAPITAEVGEIILDGNYPREAEISIFQSMGMASEDACVAQAVRYALSLPQRFPY
ncbi:ketimine reductase mu-crystallin [Drosophila sechellia]|uniref:Ketimine reductase mu-crystallin n=1 Tax=Drosophila sechellia TaxID=7238 RepID=B4IEU5_DROSE|nr:ketimine reductase mu-crystallin [Drosophila sechellia]EDW46199.1 GM13473 [Drosophila sechellia]